MIVDTGVVYAGFDRRDDWHARSAQLLNAAHGPLRMPSLVVTEVCYLLGARLGAAAEADFLAALGHLTGTPTWPWAVTRNGGFRPPAARAPAPARATTRPTAAA